MDVRADLPTVEDPQSNEHQDTVQEDAEEHRVNSVNRMQYGRSIN